MHTDDSDVTLNVCLGKDFEAAGLCFCGACAAPRRCCRWLSPRLCLGFHRILHIAHGSHHGTSPHVDLLLFSHGSHLSRLSSGPMQATWARQTTVSSPTATRTRVAVRCFTSPPLLASPRLSSPRLLSSPPLLSSPRLASPRLVSSPPLLLSSPPSLPRLACRCAAAPRQEATRR